MASLPEGKSWGLGLVPSQGSIEFGGGGGKEYNILLSRCVWGCSSQEEIKNLGPPKLILMQSER